MILMSITTSKLPLILLLMMVIVSAGSLIQLQPVSATFPGANGKIVFTRYIGTTVSQTEIFTVNPDGSGLTQLTSTGQSYDPRWSADGTKIAFTSDRAGRSAIWVMNADGSGQTQVTHPPASAKNYQPAFSPDGSKIVFENDSGSIHPNIWVTNIDGTNQKQLTTTTAGGDYWPVWSPNGLKIVFVSSRTGQFQIFVMNPDGSSPTDISNSPSYVDFFPEWSPDGRMIAFGRRTEAGHFMIWVMNADGTGKKQLSTPPSGLDDWSPAWSPDGTKMAFTRGIGGSIIVMNADGSNPTDITQSQPFSDTDDAPNWQPLIARPVGGVVMPTNKLEVMTPYLTLAGLAVALSAVVVVKKRRD